MVIRVAVIGAGAAGLCALRYLTAQPSRFLAVGFEILNQVGGTWVYTDRVGTDEHGLPIQSSMYKNLRTNLPKEVMPFPGFSFPSHLPSFIGHRDVLQYLDDYATHYNLHQFIKFGTVVQHVEPLIVNDVEKWVVSYTPVSEQNSSSKLEVDAVIVCNGHYAVPLIPEIPGMEIFKGTIIHSHNYRTSEPFKGHTVVCLGAAASGQDISVDLAAMAKKVVLSHNKPPLQTVLLDNMCQRPGIKQLQENSVIFSNDEEMAVDTLLLCTGYQYHFPFLSEKCQLAIEDGRVWPLYKHIIHTRHSSLSFIGICKTICPFPQFNNQVRFVLSVLEGALKLPSADDMEKDIEEDFNQRLSQGLPGRRAHTMGPRQWAYNDSLSSMANFEPIPKNVQQLYDEVHRMRVQNLPTYKSLNYALEGDSYKLLES